VELNGRSLIGFSRGQQSSDKFYAVNPASGERLGPMFLGASAAEADHAAELAGVAFEQYSRLPGKRRAAFLRTIAENIEALGEALVERAIAETGLSADRIRSERDRTRDQLRLFADVVEEGSWVDARIDRADAARKPLPKPDVRSMLRPLGPVVVFGASNFPLAFSAAGGDTASALAAGNPVIVKAHAAHPGTGEMVGRVVVDAVRACALPEGTFSLVFGAGARVGAALVQHPAIKAGGFTGSRAAGRALAKLATERSEPIPFYAEMSSTNPVFVLPGALRARAEQIATGLHVSVMLGAGQFCTKPGMVIVEDDAEAEKFAAKLARLVDDTAESVLLTSGIHSSYCSGVAARSTTAHLLAQSPAPAGAGYHAGAALFEADGASFLANPDLAAELFGPATMIIRHSGRDELMAIARGLEGHLTATIHATDKDLHDYAGLVAVLENKVGRIVVNGFPTGVEVGHAMVHGGPHPATSDSRTTSVGTRAILRFARPVCFQNFPNPALPPELQDINPLSIWRMLDGQLRRDAIQRAEPLLAAT
jgi:2,5-dioxopentanoate dehydrogenase